MEISRKEIVFQPLESHECISVISCFCDLLVTSSGPEGRIKILVTSGGYSVVTSSSDRILRNLPLSNPICLFISQVVKSQLSEFKDFGLFTGILASSLIANVALQKDVYLNEASCLIHKISSDFKVHLNSIKMKVDFSTVRQLFPFIESILLSKSASGLSISGSKELTITIVKAFLNSVNEDVVGNVIVMCGEGSDLQNFVYSGVLYQTVYDYLPALIKEINSRNKIPLILFNIMLSTEKFANSSDIGRASIDVDIKKGYDVENTLKVIKCAVEKGVRIVACQKVVHPFVKLFLQRNGVLLLDRMGTELTRNMEMLSGAVPISELDKCSKSEHLVPLLGYVSAVSQIKRGKKSYLSFERKDRSVTTLIVSGINEEASEELKITTNQALQSLRHLLADPYLLPGAGCTEMSLIASLEMSTNLEDGKYRVPLHQLYACLRLLQMSLLKAAGFRATSLSTLSVDTAYYHAWTVGEESGACRCGLVTSSMVNEEEKSWQNLDLNAAKLLSDCELPKNTSLAHLNDGVVLDLFAGKSNAIKLSLECYAALMEIGMVVYSPLK